METFDKIQLNPSCVGYILTLNGDGEMTKRSILGQVANVET